VDPYPFDLDDTLDAYDVAGRGSVVDVAALGDAIVQFEGTSR
jgi:hypothetical protein